MRIYLIAIGKILKSGINISFLIIDAIVFIIGIVKPDYRLRWYIYFTILIIGYVIAAIKIVAESIKMPEVAIYFKGEGERRKLRIRNISNPATNLRDFEFQDIEIGDNKGEITLHFELEGDTNLLIPKEERDVIFSYSVEGKEKEDNFLLANLDPKYANENYELRVFYVDKSNKYEMIFSLGKDKIRVSKLPRLI